MYLSGLGRRSLTMAPAACGFLVQFPFDPPSDGQKGGVETLKMDKGIISSTLLIPGSGTRSSARLSFEQGALTLYGD